MYNARMTQIRLTWYGRCCFLLELGDKKVLIDPHDTFDSVDMGRVDADYVLISSVAHDHGHVGASPWAYAVGTPGMFVNEDIAITGIPSRESRGTPNIIFNIRYGDLSITNFADFGDPSSLDTLPIEAKSILKTTNIALVRPNYVEHMEGVQGGELALQYCDPAVVIVHHFYPESFIQKHPKLDKARVYHGWIDDLLPKISYFPQKIFSYELELDSSVLQSKQVFVLEEVHPQVLMIE